MTLTSISLTVAISHMSTLCNDAKELFTYDPETGLVDLAFSIPSPSLSDATHPYKESH